MSEKPDQEKIINEAKRLNPNVSDALVTEISIFLNSNLNKTELNSSSLRQLTGKFLEKLFDSIQTDEN